MNPSNKKTIFIITGHAHSGKDTFFNAIEEIIHNRGFTYHKSSFAKFLKILAHQWILDFYGCEIPLEYFDNPIEKEREYPQYRFRNRALKIRDVLQYMGTDIFRNQINPIFWVEQLYLREIRDSTADFFFITDCRFPNEIQYLESKGLNLYIVNITRTLSQSRDESDLSKDNKTHESEQHIANIPYHKRIINSFATVEEYSTHCCHWIQQWLKNRHLSPIQDSISITSSASSSTDSLQNFVSETHENIEYNKIRDINYFY
jgi:hypothetical protein